VRDRKCAAKVSTQQREKNKLLGSIYLTSDSNSIGARPSSWLLGFLPMFIAANMWSMLSAGSSLNRNGGRIGFGLLARSWAG
jgi:hypothetical protein